MSYNKARLNPMQDDKSLALFKANAFVDGLLNVTQNIEICLL